MRSTACWSRDARSPSASPEPQPGLGQLRPHPRSMQQGRARCASSDFTCTGRYHPVRMICASPSASFWSVLFICILSAALACLALRQTTSSPRPRSSCTSQGVIGPVSTPILASPPACPLTVRSICPGSVAHWPRHNLRPVSSTTQSAVSFCDTSKPTNRAIEPPPMVQRPGNPPGSRHHGRPMPPPRLPDVHTCITLAQAFPSYESFVPGCRRSGASHPPARRTPA